MLQKIMFWLEDHSPVWCAVCGKLIFHKDATYRQMTNGRIVPLCPACDKKFFWGG